MDSTSPVVIEQVRQYPFGLDNNVMDNNEFEVDEIQVGGGFFDDDPLMGTGRGAARQDIRSHLDDLANRHPEFADSLRGPSWAGSLRRSRAPLGPDEAAASNSGSSASASSGASSSSGAASSASAVPSDQQEQSDEPGPLRGRSTLQPQQRGLRNTVPDMAAARNAQDASEQRGQRSWSAPPDSRAQTGPQRFVSRLEINPVNPEEQQPQLNQENQSRPPPAPRPQQQQAPKAASNVRHIPIFVEGRDEPIVARDTVDASRPSPPPPQFTSHAQHHFAQQPKPFQQPNRSFNKSPRPFQAPQQEQPQQQPSTSNEEPSHLPPPPPPQPAQKVDPISKVEAIQSEIDKLRAEVEAYSGSSRKDKDYVYIDEMLTRNLLKLDDIETEGRDDIRQARKSAIRNIQECISNLEEKVPQEGQLTESQVNGMEVALCQGQEVVTDEPMDTTEAS